MVLFNCCVKKFDTGILMTLVGVCGDAHALNHGATRKTLSGLGCCPGM